MTEFEDRERALSFGDDPETYDWARPSYPSELVDDLLGYATTDVLDIGCGTGIAGRLFVARGCRVVGVEPDPRMAVVARRHGIDVDESTFEAWARGRRDFDLAVAGQSWHWVDPTVGAAKVADCLRHGGTFAAFWNGDATFEDGVGEVMRRVHRELAPEMVGTSVMLPAEPEEDGPDLDVVALTATGRFRDVEVRRYPWTRTYTPAQWLAELTTHSSYRGLGSERLGRFADALRQGLGDLVSFPVGYRTYTVIASRR